MTSPAELEGLIERLSKSQIDGLRCIRDFGPEGWSHGIKSRAGGARSRMFDRLVTAGLVSAPPYKLTGKGRSVLRALAGEKG